MRAGIAGLEPDVVAFALALMLMVRCRFVEMRSWPVVMIRVFVPLVRVHVQHRRRSRRRERGEQEARREQANHWHECMSTPRGASIGPVPRT